MDFNFYGAHFDGSEPIFKNGVVVCNYYWKCKLSLRVWNKLGTGYYAYFYGRGINANNEINQEYTVDEFNQVVVNAFPFKGTILYAPNNIGCSELWLSTGWEDMYLGGTCDGILPPFPPPPSVPVFCSVSGLSSDTVDFGELVQGRAASRSITASLACSGDKNTVGKGRLLITDPARSGAATAALRNAQSGAEIKVRLSVGEENGSNEKRFDVRAGYQTQTPIYFSLDAGETINKPGYFSGSALLIFDVL